jgi:dTDP-4-amino-4,6-dideoxygalactose transaminase
MGKLAVNGGTPIRTKPFTKWPIHGELEEKMVLEVIRSGNWGGVLPDKIKQLEEEFAALHGANYAVSVNNGTVALTIALLAAGVDKGDEVIIPPYTFLATATAPLLIGAIPIFVDVDETMLIDPDLVEAAITPNTKAIIAVHLAGGLANMTRLKEIAAKYNLVLIEDAAQAVTAKWEGQGAGTLGDLATFSLQSSKNLNSGEGGIILTNSTEMAELAWSIKNCGRIRNGGWYQHEIIGWNFRMTELQAALALSQMSRLEEQTILRAKNAKLLNELVTGIDGMQVMPIDNRITRHANHLYMFRLDKNITGKVEKADFIKKVNAEGIPLSPGYVPLNRNTAIIERIKKLAGEERLYTCPVAEQASEKEILWLGQNVLLGTEEDMFDIARALQKVIDSYF